MECPSCLEQMELIDGVYWSNCGYRVYQSEKKTNKFNDPWTNSRI